MQSLSKLKPSAAPIFLDTSVLINLIAADCVEMLGEALGRLLFVENYVVGELRHDPRTGKDATEILNELVSKGALRMATLTEAQMIEFLRLVAAPIPDDLGDGEAATIACSLEHGFAAIDERKALRIVARDHPTLTAFSTLDLLCSGQAFRYFGEDRVRDTVTRALRIGRMRVPHPWRAWVNTFIG